MSMSLRPVQTIEVIDELDENSLPTSRPELYLVRNPEDSPQATEFTARQLSYLAMVSAAIACSHAD